jgi:hypothetical protein
MSAGNIQNICQIRTEFFRRAIFRTRELVSEGDFCEVKTAVTQLRKYYEWMKAEFSDETKKQLELHIAVLEQAVRNLASETEPRARATAKMSLAGWESLSG